MPGNVPTMSVPYPHPMFGVDTILGAHFDGSNDYLTRGADLTGNADTQVFTFAARLRTTQNIDQQLIQSTGAKVSFQLRSSNKIIIEFRNSSNTRIWRVFLHTITGADTDDGNYHNYLFSLNLAATLVDYFYVDDNEQTLSPSEAVEGETIDWTQTEHSVGALVGGTSKFNGDIEFLYIDNVAYNFDTESNRRKFFDGSGDPVLDPTGDGTPSGGAQPLVYHAGTYDQWESNKGTGGGMTVTGALTEPAS